MLQLDLRRGLHTKRRKGEVISTHNWKAGGQQNREAPFLEYMHAWPGRSIDCGTDGQRRRGAAELGNTLGRRKVG